MLRLGKTYDIDVGHVKGGNLFFSIPGHEFRLDGYDPPERDQPGYYEAKRELASLIGDKTVSLNAVARDAYDRFICQVTLGAINVNDHMRSWAKKHGYQH